MGREPAVLEEIGDRPVTPGLQAPFRPLPDPVDEREVGEQRLAGRIPVPGGDAECMPARYAVGVTLRCPDRAARENFLESHAPVRPQKGRLVIDSSTVLGLGHGGPGEAGQGHPVVPDHRILLRCSDTVPPEPAGSLEDQGHGHGAMEEISGRDALEC